MVILSLEIATLLKIATSLKIMISRIYLQMVSVLEKRNNITQPKPLLVSSLPNLYTTLVNPVKTPLKVLFANYFTYQFLKKKYYHLVILFIQIKL